MSSIDVYSKLISAPVTLAPNTYLHFYNGGKLRAEFVGEKDPKDDFRSEEWIFSTNRAITPGRENPPDKGYSRVQLPDGSIVLLQEILKALPAETLGVKHFEKFGSSLGVLLKIFDVGDGAHIPVHWHPSPEFASRYLNSPNGKNEAWIVLGTRPGATTWIGWKEDITKEQFREWMEAQDVETMRSHMHVVKPKPRDVIFLRDSFVHSLGSGVCILEPQEPTDWNILSEWKGFPYGRDEGSLGLDWDVALDAARFDAMPLDYLNNYVKRTPKVARKENGSIEEHLVPPEARKYFWVTRLIVRGKMTMPSGQGFYCMVTTQGEGALIGPFGEVPTKRGKSFFIPTSLAGFDVVSKGSGPLEVVCCYPPALE